MSIIQSTIVLAALALVSQVAGHGILQGIIADGQWYPGYNPWVDQVTAAWKIAYDIPGGTWTGPVFSTQYQTSDIICGNGSTPGGSYIKVTAGSKMELQWSPWPLSHPGPVMTYLAACGNDCTKVDKTTLKFNKIDQQGLLSPTTVPAYPPFTWGANTLRDNNSTWVLTIPASIAPGKYVLRNEIIALHYAWNPQIGGAQNYPMCVNLEVSSTGTDPLTGGTLGPALYKNTDPGIDINVFGTLDHGYTIPGPPLYTPVLGVSKPTPSPSSPSSPKPPSSLTTTTTTITTTTTTSKSLTSPTIPTFNFPVSPSTSWPSTSTTTTITPTTTTSSILTSILVLAKSTTTSFPNQSFSTHSFTLPSISNTFPSPPPSASTPSGTLPISFTSTISGRIGKPTKFTCYLEEE